MQRSTWARAWRGTQFAPEVVDAFVAAAPEVLAGLDVVADWETSIMHEPRLQARVTEAGFDSALEAMADFTDLRSVSRTGHARAVAGLSARAAELAGLPPADVTTLRRAALVHDVGMNGVPATILDKPGPLSASETERMRMHAYYTDRMLARPPALNRIGAIAAMATERLDGSGYHRGLSGASSPPRDGSSRPPMRSRRCANPGPTAHHCRIGRRVLNSALSSAPDGWPLTPSMPSSTRPGSAVASARAAPAASRHARWKCLS